MASKACEEAAVAFRDAYSSLRSTRKVRAAAPGSCRHISQRWSSSAASDARPASGRRQERRTRPLVARGSPTVPGPPESVAVLGGGLTGLVTAWYLARYCPKTHITVYEASDRVGGWLQTETRKIKVDDGRKGQLCFERGARTVKTQTRLNKYDDIVLFDLIYNLPLRDKLRWTLQQDRLRRYIYYPDHLVELSFNFTSPSGLWEFLCQLTREPLFEGTLPSVFNYLLYLSREPKRVAWNQHKLVRDLSIGQFFFKALGGRRELIDNVLSALLHGIYGADVWQQSMESSIFDGFLMDNYKTPRPKGYTRLAIQDLDLVRTLTAGDADFAKFVDALTLADYLSFHGGLATLTDAIAADLRKNRRVTIRMNERATQIRDHPPKVAVTTSRCREPDYYDKVISTILAQQLAPLTGGKLPTLAECTATSIALVNLWYPEQNLDKGATGFGYLIPSSSTHNPNAVLGVIFDSDREAMFDMRHLVTYPPSAGTAAPALMHGKIGGTKLTVMMGGHLWDAVPREYWPDEVRVVEMAKEAVAAQLPGLAAATVPPVASAAISWDCIPRHNVGHFGRMRAAHDELERAFGGRLAVAGGSYQLPGVLTAVRAGRDIAAQTAGLFRATGEDHGLFEHHLGPMPDLPDLPNGDRFWSPGPTGLARFGTHMMNSYLLSHWDDLPFRYRNGGGPPLG